ncbi:MAG TPA: hypothetical protein VKX16_18170, partial [Chloroflexota bacterium]|nr:hypothetical protein [Chloroflexota bacterium]
RIPSAIGRDVEVMVAEVEAQVDDFQLELDEIAAVFAGGSHGTARGGPAGARLLQLALTLGDIGGLTDQVMGIGDWTVLVTRMVQQAILVFLVATFLTGGNALIALFIVEAIRLGTSEGEIKKRLRRSLGERLHAALREQVQEKRAFIHGAIEERFRRFARDMTGVIGSEIDQVRAEQERILTQKRDERFSVEVEKQRLDTIAIELDRLFSGLHTALNGEP